jgi:hypothetical protein
MRIADGFVLRHLSRLGLVRAILAGLVVTIGLVAAGLSMAGAVPSRSVEPELLTPSVDNVFPVRCHMS